MPIVGEALRGLVTHRVEGMLGTNSVNISGHSLEAAVASVRRLVNLGALDVRITTPDGETHGPAAFERLLQTAQGQR